MLAASQKGEEGPGIQQLATALLESGGLPDGTDLSRLHENPTAKDRLLYSLTQTPGPFREAYDAFVRGVCLPKMARALEATSTGSTPCNEIYCQAFPCVRIVRPGDFSIGPHSDVSYGHHPCSMNAYVTLTDAAVSGEKENGRAPSSALFLESRPGEEDWHALVGSTPPGSNEEQGRGPRPKNTEPAGGSLAFFPGAVNLHWTTENHTESTRISLDFRLIDGRVFSALECGGHLEGGQTDVYRRTPGYYRRCVLRGGDGAWVFDDKDATRAGPDFRVGFPWTVRNWEKFWKKQARAQNNNTATIHERNDCFAVGTTARTETIHST